MELLQALQTVLGGLEFFDNRANLGGEVFSPPSFYSITL